MLVVYCRVAIALGFMFALAARAEVSNDEMNASNNPIARIYSVNFQDYIGSSLYGTDETTNSFILRGVAPHMLGNWPQILRATIPYQSVPGPEGDQVTGLGDVNLFNVFAVPGPPGVEFGVGPYMVLPTASDDETGAGKWQIGAAVFAIAPQKWGMLGGLFTYQHDFAGDDDRPTQNIANLQPFVIFNLPNAFYLRTTGTWFFNWETGDYYIPVGLGLGKIWKLESGVTVNAFAEPQWTLAHEGDGLPNYQTFIGLNFQFGLK